MAKMDAQRCISVTTPPNYIEKYQIFSTNLEGIPGFPFTKRQLKPMISNNSFFKVALQSLTANAPKPLPHGFGGLRRSPRSLEVGAFTSQGVARHAGLVGNVDVPKPGGCAILRVGSMEVFSFRKVNFKCAGHVCIKII